MCLSNPTRLISGFIVVSALAAFAPNALAETSDRSDFRKSITVHYDDLNLESESDARALVNRVAAAATKVCGDPNTFQLQLKARWQFETCRSDAIQSAIAMVGHPRVTSIYEKKQSTVKRLASR